MAERRMISKKITDTDAFLDMPLTTQALYFHFLGLWSKRAACIGRGKYARRGEKMRGVREWKYS